MSPKDIKLASWNSSFPRLKKVFFYFLVIIFTIGNLIDYYSVDIGLKGIAQDINIIYIVFSLTILSAYYLKLIQLNTASLLAVYSILINIFISLFFSIDHPNFELLYLRETIILGILIIPTGFILNRIHILIIGALCLMLFVWVLFITDQAFIKNSAIILSIAYVSYIAWVYYLLNILDQWFTKQEELFSELEYRNVTLDEKTIELDKINKTKDRLFSVMAHDLKNPFNAIFGFSDLLLKRKAILTEEKKEKYYQMIHNASGESINLLDNLLNWATTQTDSILFNPSEIKIKYVIKGILDYFEIDCTKKEVKINTKYDKELTVYADVNMLNTILRNLISNAIKFSHRKSEINIEIKNNNKEVLFAVTDTGVGFNSDVKTKLFKIEQEHTSLGTEREKGTGLGLIICKDFVKRHYGSIQIESKVNEGTCIQFTIPKN